MANKPSIRCAIYTRKSTEEGLEQEFNSLDAQRESCEAYITSQKAEGWAMLPKPYDDGGFSGGTLERPALKTLLADIEAGSVDIVVVYKIDRLTRSLMDFAKLVEVFDRKAVTFVSVTQSFNTTTSMGRLTLNVLLSFAQFEREVTGERIRDKFAASRKKGMWMGGNPPIGYDIKDRKLVVNQAEAKAVRLIFKRYLEVGSVRALKDDLADKRITSKSWTSSTAIHHGGTPFDRGALYCLLKNRLYIGDVTYKGAPYPGEQPAIVDRDLFEAVQDHLANARRRTIGKSNLAQGAPFEGILFNQAGTLMTPTYTAKAGGRRYRYYASTSRSQPNTAGAVTRVSAPALETLIDSILVRLQLPQLDVTDQAGPAFVQVLQRIDLANASTTLRLDREAALKAWRREVTRGLSDVDLITHQCGVLTVGEVYADHGDHIVVTLPVRARFRGGDATIVAPAVARAPTPDASLIKALARAHHWKELLLSGEIKSVDTLAAKFGQERRHTGRILSLAFLSPDITRAILQGRQPLGLRLTNLLDANLPLAWSEQDRHIRQIAARQI